MDEAELIRPFVDMANSMGEDLNDRDEWPGWMTAKWISGNLLEITYEDQENVSTAQRYRIERVED